MTLRIASLIVVGCLLAMLASPGGIYAAILDPRDEESAGGQETATEEKAVAALRSTLASDPNEEKKFGAAVELIEKHADDDHLIQTLTAEATEASVRQAIVRAYGFAKKATLLRPLLAYVETSDQALAKRVVDYYDIIRHVYAAFSTELRAVARDPNESSPCRVGAVKLLGIHEILPATDDLIALLESKEIPQAPVHHALVQITRHDYGHEAGPWREWWGRAKDLERTDILEQRIGAMDKELERRKSEIRALIQLRIEENESVAGDYLAHEDPSVRHLALDKIAALAKVQTVETKERLLEARKTIVSALNGESFLLQETERVRFVEVLGDLWRMEPVDEAKATLLQALDGGSWGERRVAASALRTGPDESGELRAALRAHLKRALGVEKPEADLIQFVISAVQSLGALLSVAPAEQRSEADFDVLRRAMELPSVDLRRAVCESLGRIAAPEGRFLLERALSPEDLGADPTVRFRAVSELAKIAAGLPPEQRGDLLNALAKGLDDESHEVRRQSVEKIGEISTDQAFELLRDRFIANGEHIASVREQFVHELGRLGGERSLVVLCDALVKELAGGGTNGSANGGAKLADVLQTEIKGICGSQDVLEPAALVRWATATRHLINKGKGPASVWALSELLARFPKEPAVVEGEFADFLRLAVLKFALAESLLVVGDPARSYKEVEGLEEADGFDLLDPKGYWGLRGNAASLDSRWSEAAEAFEKLASLFAGAEEGRERARLSAAKARLEAGQPKLALEALRQLDAVYGSDPAFLENAARAAQLAGDWPAAETYLLSLLDGKVAPGSLGALDATVRLCEVLVSNGRIPEAQERLTAMETPGEIPDTLAKRIEELRQKIEQKLGGEG